MTSPFLATSADTRPLEVPSQLTSLFLSSSPTWYFIIKRTILFTWLSWRCHLKITSRKLTIVRLRNIETLFLTFWIMDSPVIWLVLKLDHVDSLPLKTSGTLKTSSLLLMPNHLSHSGRNSAKWPFWLATPSGTLGRSRPGALKINRCSEPNFLFVFGVLLPSAGFISEFLCLTLCFFVFCVYTALRRSEPLGSLLVLGLNVLPFFFACIFALVVENDLFE